MRRIISVAIIFLACLNVEAQTFNGTGGSIPDYNGISPSPAYFPCIVSGLPASIDSATFGLERVCINVTHTYDRDLEIKLMSPDSFIVMLSHRNGEDGHNYISTCFRGYGANGLIINGPPPFTGEFDPDSDIFQFNNGRNPNGTWYLIITDLSQSDVGTLNSFHLVFSNNPTPHSRPPCSVNDARACYCPDGSQDCDLLPDMTSSGAALLAGSYESNDTLYVDNATPNIGWGPLEIHGIDSCYCDSVLVSCDTVLCPNGMPPKQFVIQTVYHKDTAEVTTWTRAAGTMSFHPTHHHTHVDDWASYSLRRPVFGLSPPDWPVIGQGYKISFCLVNLGICSTRPGDNGYCVDSTGSRMGRQNLPNFGMGVVSGCNNDQGIFVGNYDEYTQNLPEQWIILDSLCNGNYFLVSITDPDNVILESNENNNWVAVPFTLTQQANLPFPSANFSFSGAANTITFSNGSSDYDSVSWDFGDATSDTAVNPVHTYSSTGIYTVVLTAYNHCGFQQRVDTVDLTLIGIYESGQKDVYSFSVYPNPSAKQMKIDFSMSKRSPVTLRLFDAFGKSIRTLADQSLNAGSHQYVIDASEMNLAKGVYSVQLTSAETTITKRIVFVK